MLRRSLPSLALGLLVSAGFASPAAAQRVTLRGRLEVLHSDDFRHAHAQFAYVLRFGSRRVWLRFRGDGPEQLGGTRVRVRGDLRDGVLRVRPGRFRVVDARRVADGRRWTAFGATGAQKVAVILFNFTTDPANQPWTPDQVRQIVFTSASSLNAYEQEQSFGKLSLTGKVRADGDVFGWYTIDPGTTPCDVFNWSTAARTAAQGAGVDLSGYDHFVYLFPTSAGCGWAGLGEMPGDSVWINGSLSVYVVGHELGHNLGANHANSLRCTDGTGQPVAMSTSCTSSEYGDPFDIMGGGPRHENNWHKAQYGWFAPANTTSFQGNGTYTLAAEEASSGAPQLLRIARGSTGNYYFLELRQPFGTYFDAFGSTDPVVNGVSIRLCPDYPVLAQSQLIDATPETSTFSDAALAPGRTFVDSAYGISITTVSVTAGVATVDVQVAGAPPVDATAPTAPTAAAALVTGPAVSLSWSGATDNLGVAGYRIYRDGAQVSATAASTYLDWAVAAGRTYTYVVYAYDAAGNVGPASNAVTITVSTPRDHGDTAPPVIRALPGRGRHGRVVPLRFTVSDDSGRATVTARVSRRGRVVGRLRARSILADPKRISSFSWRAPRALRGRAVFCVTARDGAGHSASSCAALRIR